MSTTSPRGRDLTEFSTRAPIETLTGFTSSNVHSGLYDFGTNDLYIRYLRDGVDAIYVYSFVPASTWQGLVDARSKGSFINRKIAYSYRYERISLGEWPQQGRGVEDPVARRFLTAPMTPVESASHPHYESQS